MATEAIELHGALTGLSTRSVQRVLEQYDPLTWTRVTAKIKLPKATGLGAEDYIRFDNHPFMPAIYRDTHPHIVALKGAQIGFSTWAIIRDLWASTTWPMSSIYTIGGTDINQHVQARINPIISASEYLADRLLDVDSVGMKRFAMQPTTTVPMYARGKAARIRYFSVHGLSTAYFSGANSQAAAISRDADVMFHDEVDKSDQEVIELYRSRISGPSHFKWTVKLSTPTIPGWGIDREYRLSDMRHWLIKCPGCNEYNELAFPESLQPQTWEEHTLYHETVVLGDPCPDCYYVCRSCKRRMSDVERAMGTWVPEKADPRLPHGYAVSQMAAIYMPANEILRARAEAVWPASFWNNTMGIAHDEGTAAFTEQAIVGIPGIDHGRTDPDREMAIRADGGTFLGVDVGGFLDWVCDTIENGRPRTIAFGRIGGNSQIDPAVAWRELDELMDRFNVTTCVIDALPEMSMVRQFKARWNRPGATPRVYGSFYNLTATSALPARFDNEGAQVSSPRDRGLSETAEELLTRKLLPKYNPSDPVWVAFVKHHLNSKRVAVLQKGLEREGIVESYQWVNIGADHLFHAENYARLARLAPRGALAPTVGLVTLNRSKLERNKAKNQAGMPPPVNRRRG